jgi:uncharacterized protein (DUF697 family)
MLKIPAALTLIREINPATIHAEADTPVEVLIVGEPEPAEGLARLFTEGSPLGEHHPWIARQGLVDITPPRRPERSLALFSLTSPVVADETRRAVERLRSLGVPTVCVMFDNVTAALGGVAAVHGAPRVSLREDAPPAEFEATAVPTIIGALPEDGGADLALARQFPVLRREYCRRVVEATARTNALYALTTGIAGLSVVLDVPLVLADIVLITKNQIVMSYKIALASGRADRPRVLLTEIVGVIGAGMLFRQIARELVGLIPGVGIVPKVAIAYAGTRLIGAVVIAWALEGRRLEMSEIRVLYAGALEAAQSVAGELQARVRSRSAGRAARRRRGRSVIRSGPG